MKAYTRAAALALAAAMVLGGCSNKTETAPETKPADTNKPAETKPAETQKPAEDKKEAKEIKDLVLGKVASRELTTFNMLYCQDQSNSENLTNLVDGLLEMDNKGQLVPCLAESWNTEDGGINWTFKIREGLKWVDINGNEKADCNAYDFATGLEWVLNYHKNESANTAMPIEMIKGAQEYYDYTKSLSKEEAEALTAGEGSKFLELVGVACPDPQTIVYTCLSEKPYFPTLGPYSCLYPMAQGMVEELGGAEGVRSMNNENMWYNGCYTMTKYIQGNEKVFTKNPMYWDTEAQRFDTVTIKMIESNDVAFQLYQSGEIDYTTLTESNLKIVTENPNHEFHDYIVPDAPSRSSYQFHFNFHRLKDDGTPDVNWNTAIANEAFRKAWYYGLDLTDYFKRTNAIDPLKCENNAFVMEGLAYKTDGTEYSSMVRERLGIPASNGETPVRLNKEKAEEYKKQAIEELTALGVTFPVTVEYWIAGGNQVALDSANVLADCIKKSMGEEYMNMHINTYVSSFNKEVRVPSVHSIATNGWGADYGDPMNFLGQDRYERDNAYYANYDTHINEVEETEATKAVLDTYREFTKMVEEADAITDLDARYEAFADAEAFMIEHCLVIPLNYGKGWALSKYDLSTKQNGIYGVCNEKMKNWATNSNGYTTEEAAEWFK